MYNFVCTKLKKIWNLNLFSYICSMIKVECKNNGNLPDVWIFSDPHYNHKNICRGVTNWRLPNGDIPIGSTRDFDSLEKMNSTIVNNINNVVRQDDVLICLGDWSFGGFESIKMFIDRIVCKDIHLILGNHDHHIEGNREGCQGYFKSVSIYNTLKYREYTFKLMHYPISSWDGLSKGVIHLHGHCHLPTNLRFGIGKRMDVGMDGHPEFRPYHIKECIQLMEKRPISSEISKDHHINDVVEI
jgi:calcineurin-like phosphoesterase family protein